MKIGHGKIGQDGLNGVVVDGVLYSEFFLDCLEEDADGLRRVDLLVRGEHMPSPEQGETVARAIEAATGFPYDRVTFIVRRGLPPGVYS